jgi:hypothetical protein
MPSTRARSAAIRCRSRCRSRALANASPRRPRARGLVPGVGRAKRPCVRLGLGSPVPPPAPTVPTVPISEVFFVRAISLPSRACLLARIVGTFARSSTDSFDRSRALLLSRSSCPSCRSRPSHSSHPSCSPGAPGPAAWSADPGRCSTRPRAPNSWGAAAPDSLHFGALE